MRLPILLLASLLATACSKPPSPAQAGSPASPEASQAAAIAAGESQAPAAPAASAQPGKRGTATGTITAIDMVGGKISISHGPVDALGWPAMTMAFAATPQQLAATRAGEKVDFEFVASGMDATLTRIEPAK